MTNELLRQLQNTTRELPLRGFDVVLVAFGNIFQGTIVSRSRFLEVLKAVVNAAVPPTEDPYTYNVVTTARGGLVKAIAESAGGESDKTLYLNDVRISGGAEAKIIAIPLDEVKAWCLVGGRALEMLKSE